MDVEEIVEPVKVTHSVSMASVNFLFLGVVETVSVTQLKKILALAQQIAEDVVSMVYARLYLAKQNKIASKIVLMKEE
jgi:hypothetical protein